MAIFLWIVTGLLGAFFLVGIVITIYRFQKEQKEVANFERRFKLWCDAANDDFYDEQEKR